MKPQGYRQFREQHGAASHGRWSPANRRSDADYETIMLAGMTSCQAMIRKRLGF
jgi:hypothetical protein